MHNKVLKVATLVILPIISTLCFFFTPASAINISETIADKAIYQGVYRCYTGGYIYSNISSLDNYRGTNDPMYYLVDNGRDSGDNYVKFVTGWTGRGIDVHNDYGLPCSDFFKGGNYSVNGSSKNLLEVFGKSAPQKGESNGVIELTENMGYVVTGGDENRCYGLRYTHAVGSASAGTFTTNQVCQNDDGTLSANNPDPEAIVTFGVTFRDELCVNVESIGNIGCATPQGESFNGDQLLRTVNTILGSTRYEYDRYGKIATIIFDTAIDQSAGEGVNLRNASASFKNNNSQLAAMTALNFLSDEAIGVNDTEKIKITPLEKRRLYQAYLASFYGVEINCEEGQNEYAFDGTIQNWLVDGTMKTCYYDTNNAEHESETVNGVDGDGYLTITLSLEELIEAIKGLPDTYSGEDLNSINDDQVRNPNNITAETASCWNSGGAGSLGWIVCSILDWMSHATDGLYEDLVEPVLRVEPGLFNAQSENGSAEDAWKVFRDFTNIVFIILLLVVIISQVTGVGIDNYGIKKILPKLIIVAVLINLSYLICLICVDVSNIVGNGIQDVFTATQQQMAMNAESDNTTLTITDINNSGQFQVDVPARTGITAVAIAGAAIGVYSIYHNPALLLTLFITVLGVLISIIFVFILLAGRKAVIVLLTVISPLAFIMYTLPNTKKIFDKWLNLWKAMLLVYPICSLLISGGNFASQLMLIVGRGTETAYPAATIFTAMVVGIVPIFFIPTVIRNAYSALGSVGGVIAGFGNRLRGGFTRGARNTNLVRNAQKRSQDRAQRINAMRRAGVRLDRNGNVVESRRPIARLRRGIAQSDSGFLGWVNRRTGLQASMGQSAAEFAKMEAARRDGIDNADINMINTQFAKDENARMMRRAEAQEGVATIDEDVARRRARAARDAQAYKAFQDQYANYSVSQLKAEAGRATALRGGADGSQRISALINAMESRGMENDIVNDILRADRDIHTDASVMATLANSNNKVLKAFGKKGETDFASFMSGADPNKNSMQKYIQSKGKEFLDGLDDKAIAQIGAYNNGKAMSTDLLVEAIAKTNNADSVRELSNILLGRQDINISGGQLASYDADAVKQLSSNNHAVVAMLKASEDIAKEPKLLNGMNPETRAAINKIRATVGRRAI